MTIASENVQNILVVAINKIGDVLLTTVLVRALAESFPQANIDVLVRDGQEGILTGNPLVRRVLVSGRRSSLPEKVVLLRHLFRRYDIAVSTGTSDRQIGYAVLAAPRVFSFLPRKGKGLWWKRRVITAGCFEQSDAREHVIERMHRLGDCIGVNKNFIIVPPAGQSSNEKLEKLLGFSAGSKRYIVIHPVPGAPQKFWRIAEWQKVINLLPRSFEVVISGSGFPADREYIVQVLQGITRPVHDLSGKLDICDCGVLLQDASALVVPDTFMGHLGAGISVPTVCLFGPSDRNLWFPWPGSRTDPLPELQDVPDDQRDELRYRLVDNVAIIPSLPSSNILTECSLNEAVAEDVVAALQALGILSSSANMRCSSANMRCSSANMRCSSANMR
jgi:heptosyltransferase III